MRVYVHLNVYRADLCLLNVYLKVFAIVWMPEGDLQHPFPPSPSLIVKESGTSHTALSHIHPSKARLLYTCTVIIITVSPSVSLSHKRFFFSFLSMMVNRSRNDKRKNGERERERVGWREEGHSVPDRCE